ncbi:hypothetical protein HrrHm1_080 [Halorubrum virus Humcor1]|nr:hypothetical protein HrrHm1_080 [Halorubrum virus Humcor1]
MPGWEQEFWLARLKDRRENPGQTLDERGQQLLNG